MTEYSHSQEVYLPPSVEHLLYDICMQQNHPLPDAKARRALVSLGEEAALEALQKISSCQVKNLAGVIMHIVRDGPCSPQSKTTSISPYQSPSTRWVHSPPGSGNASILPATPENSRMLFVESESAEKARSVWSTPEKSGSFPSLTSDRANIPQYVALGNLEFRKAFLILSYIGRERLESVATADQIQSLGQLPMKIFEYEVWKAFGEKYINKDDRRVYADWDPTKTHLYHCYVELDGSYTFKGPFLNHTRTHLQRVLGDENVLMVKFAEEVSDRSSRNLSRDFYSAYIKIAREGILLGLRRYRFFVFKDGGKEEKRKNPTSSAVKCFFVRMESDAYIDMCRPYKLSNKTVAEARSLFMHVHTVSSIPRYMARFSLILSKTLNLEIDLSTINVERINDRTCYDVDGGIVCRDGKPLIHTDGTGFISEDLALECPKNVFKGQTKRDGYLEKFPAFGKLQNRSLELSLPGFDLREPLPSKTIQIRDSMVKVEIDEELKNNETESSLEVVGTSNRPKKAVLSRNLIALLNYGGVPKEYFMNILANALCDVQGVFSSKRAALKVSFNNGDMDDFLVARMILSGIPLEESYLQYRLSMLLREEKKSLKNGKLHVAECFYLMGTTDPTGTLESDQVCVILENGHVCGKVLVYRNPGLHFGDIHVLNAVHVKESESYVGNSKYAIFFSCKGPRSVADEIAGGDFDGDMYWVSRNPKLLEYFKENERWRPVASPQEITNRKPSEFSAEELEDELFKLFLTTRFQPSYAVSNAADTWLALMDQLLTVGEDRKEERNRIKAKIYQLVNIYYDALDAPKKGGKKIEVPKYLKVGTLPHFMEKGMNSYTSTSVLGLIYDTVTAFQEENDPKIEVQKLPCFEEVPEEDVMMKWRFHYEMYRAEMKEALQDSDAKNTAAEAVIRKYKEMLYGAPELEGSPRWIEEVYKEALAIYHVTYDHARSLNSISKCCFAWKVAGSALFKLCASANKLSERSFVCKPSVVREIFS